VVLELAELAALVEDELSVEELAVDELEELTPSALSSSDRLISPSPLLSISLNSEDSCEAMLDPELEPVELVESVDWLDSRLLSVSEPNWPDGGGGGSSGAVVEVVELDTEEADEVPSAPDVSPCRFCRAVVEELPPERAD
jgi:hypothetical protein